MASVEDIIGGLQIMSRYKPSGFCSAEHDILCGPCSDDDIPVGSEDAASLEALGWHYDSEVDSWARFT